MCTGRLQWHLCQVRNFKTHLKLKYGTFRGSIGLKISAVNRHINGRINGLDLEVS